MILYGVFGDIHGPWFDQRAVNLAIKIFKHVGITHLVINGDMLDFYNINAHGPKDPEINTTLDDEMNWGNEFLDYLQNELPNVQIIYIFGNHEYRLDRFIMKNCPGFWNMLRLEKHLRLEERGIKWIPYNERIQLGDAEIFVQHSPPSYSKNPASTSLEKKMDQDHIWNCTHRTDMSARTGSSGKVYTSYCNGWFGSRGIVENLQSMMPENRRVFHFTKNHESWNSSLSIVGVHGKTHHVDQVIFKDYTAMVGGVWFVG